MNKNNHVFSEVPSIQIPRSSFRRNHNLKTTIDVDYLYPIYVGEALPAETIKVKQHLFGRLTTPVCPIMDSLYLDTFYFAVPYRLIDKNWTKFMGERNFGDTTTVYTVPQLETDRVGVAVGSLSDYLGIPPNVPNLKFCAYWHRAYNLIYNDWFRDENLCTPVPIAGLAYDGTEGTETLSDYILRKRCKRHDYFTSCLPTPQKGDPVLVSLGTSAPVVGSGALGLVSSSSARFADVGMGLSSGAILSGFHFEQTPEDISVSLGDSTIGLTASTQYKILGVSPNKLDSGLYADLSSAQGITINAFREAVAIQHLLERQNLTGSRYIEILRGMFGCISPDARMQRPEYLGGSSVPLNVTTVTQSSGDITGGSSTPLGTTGAFVTVGQDAYFSKSFTEHCLILGLANIRADLSYQQGLPRMFSRQTRYDFYWPQLANLGEQAVLNKEIYAQGYGVIDSDGNIVDDKVFGYQERWAEYRYSPNMITGLFRSQASQSLDYWHLAQEFAACPTLSQSFIEESVPIDRVLAVQDEPAMILDGWFEEEVVLPMPLYSVPGLKRL